MHLSFLKTSRIIYMINYSIMKLKNLFGAFIFTCFLFVSSLVAAQCPDAPDCPPVPDGDPDAVPIDGGLTLLLAAGVGYGIKKMRDKRAAEYPLK